MLRRNWTGFSRSTPSPSISTVPLVGSTIRLIMRRIVVLPLPEDPTSTVICRDGTTSEKSSTATVPSGKRFVTERNSIMRPKLSVGGQTFVWLCSTGPSTPAKQRFSE